MYPSNHRIEQFFNSSSQQECPIHLPPARHYETAPLSDARVMAADDHADRSTDAIRDGHTVILRKLYEPDDLRMVKVTKDATYSVFGQRVSLEHFIGIPYGSIVEIDRSNKLVRKINLTDDHFHQLFQLHNVESSTESVTLDLPIVTDEAGQVNGSKSKSACDESAKSNIGQMRDNRHLVDDQKSQKLSADQIELLKSSSANSHEIVGQLVANSDTFLSKTAFAQAKYIRKKSEKYILLIQLVKPSLRLITQYYYVTSSFKSLSLRTDSVSQILSSLNVQSSGVYLIIDTSIGLLTAALLDRIIGNGEHLANERSEAVNGKVIQIYTEAGPVASWREAIEALNYDHSLTKKCLFSLPFSQLVHFMKYGAPPSTEAASNDQCIVSSSSPPVGQSDTAVFHPNLQGDHSTKVESGAIDSSSTPMVVDDNESLATPCAKSKTPCKRTLNADSREFDEEDQAKWLEKKKKKLERKFIRKAEEMQAMDTLSSIKKANGFVLVSRGHSVEPIARVLLHFISPSAPFVIYSPTINSLMDVALFLKDQAVNLTIHESWMRKYQVLPERTRPEMSMSGSSGFILSGTKVLQR